MILPWFTYQRSFFHTWKKTLQRPAACFTRFCNTLHAAQGTCGEDERTGLFNPVSSYDTIVHTFLASSPTCLAHVAKKSAEKHKRCPPMGVLSRAFSTNSISTDLSEKLGLVLEERPATWWLAEGTAGWAGAGGTGPSSAPRQASPRSRFQSFHQAWRWHCLSL